MPVTDVSSGRIADWEAFHDVFADIHGFQISTAGT
jgi:hypothetical protein